MFTICKSFECCVFHRVENQNFDFDMTEKKNQRLACRAPHGHNGSYLVSLAARDLYKDMVIDYNEMGFVKKIVDGWLDHRGMLYQNDPLVTSLVLPQLSALHGKVEEQIELEQIPELCVGEYQVYRVKLDEKDKQPDNCFYQWLDGLLISSFNTTSECLARWMFNLVKQKIDQYNAKYPDRPDVKVASVAYKETPKSTCTYTGEDD